MGLRWRPRWYVLGGATDIQEKGKRVAQIKEVRLVDDLDGSAADETVSFSIDGASYEIDLSAGNADKLREALAEYVGSARRAGGRRRSGTASRRPSRSAGSETAEIRAWARDNGHAVSERGRIPRHIVEAYEAAH